MGSPRSPRAALLPRLTRLTLARREPLERFALEHFAFEKEKIRGGGTARRLAETKRKNRVFFRETPDRMV